MGSTTLRLAYVTLAIASIVSATALPRWDHGGGGWYGGSGGGSDNSDPGSFFNGNGGSGNGGSNGLVPNAFQSDINFNAASRARLAHGVLASLAFVIFFPFGAIAVRLLPGRLAVLVHFLLQIFGYLIFIAAAGLGLWIATTVRFNGFNLLKQYHPVIGLVLFAVLFFQPFLGILHHLNFRKHGRRGIFSHVHIWLGRIAITLGIINGGLGLRFAGNARRRHIIAYGVVAGLIWLLWVVVAVFGEARRARQTPSRAGRVDAVNHGDKHPRDLSHSPSLASRTDPVVARGAGSDKGDGRFA